MPSSKKPGRDVYAATLFAGMFILLLLTAPSAGLASSLLTGGTPSWPTRYAMRCVVGD